MKFKNRLGAPESIHIRGLSPKNEPIRPMRLGWKGGCYGFWRLFTLYFNHFCNVLKVLNVLNMPSFCSAVLLRAVLIKQLLLTYGLHAIHVEVTHGAVLFLGH